MKTMPKVLICGVLLVLCRVAPAQGSSPSRQPDPDTVDQRSFVSAALGREMPYTVVLPTSYRKGQRRYPVLYLLHGWNGDETNWIKLTHLVRQASSYPFIIVMPRAENSWYVNSATDEANRFEDYVANDLVSDVDAHFRTLTTPGKRAIAGLSMGGYGALLLTLKHPGMFGFAASISGAFDGPKGIERVLPQLQASTDAAFGPASDEARTRDDVDALIGNAAAESVPFLFLECGEEDPLLESSRRVVSELSARKLGYEYRELPGAHTWTFWDRAIEPMLQIMAQRLGGQAERERSTERKDVHGDKF